MPDAIQAAEREGRSEALEVLVPGTLVQRINDVEPALHHLLLTPEI
jgi:hypothetical protein